MLSNLKHEDINSVMRLVDKDLSEPYSIYTYRYFTHQWMKHCYCIREENDIIGVIICRLEPHIGRYVTRQRGYIAMLAVDQKHRKKRIWK